MPQAFPPQEKKQERSILTDASLLSRSINSDSFNSEFENRIIILIHHKEVAQWFPFPKTN